MIFKLSLRNVIRNRWRTAITVAAMTFALSVMIAYTGLFDGMFRMMEQNAILMDMSHIQVHAPGYRSTRSIYDAIHDAPALISYLETHRHQFSPRLFAYGLAAAGMSSSGVRIRGVDLERESKVTDLHRHLFQGKWLDASDRRGAVVGRKLAKSLNVSIGSEIVIVSQASDGSIANDIYFVRGILKVVGEDIDRGGFFIHADSFRELMVYKGDPHEIAIRLPDHSGLETEVLKIQEASPQNEVFSWRQISPPFAQLMDSFEISMVVLYLVAYAAVAIVVLNATLMAVFERIREYGLMKAFGLTPFQILVSIFLEILIQTGTACIAGITGGYFLTLYLIDPGIDLSRWTDGVSFTGIAFDPVWRAVLTPDAFVDPVVFLAGMVLIGVLYPGFKAAFVRPIRAIYSK